MNTCNYKKSTKSSTVVNWQFCLQVAWLLLEWYTCFPRNIVQWTCKYNSGFLGIWQRTPRRLKTTPPWLYERTLNWQWVVAGHRSEDGKSCLPPPNLEQDSLHPTAMQDTYCIFQYMFKSKVQSSFGIKICQVFFENLVRYYYLLRKVESSAHLKVADDSKDTRSS